MSKKYFVVADIHGFFDEMRAALNEKGFDKADPSHIFVSLGDLVDRGPQSRDVIRWVMDLPKERRILIKGNHELMLEEVLERGYTCGYDITNGVGKTLKSFCGVVEKNTENNPIAVEVLRVNSTLKSYLEECKFYEEIGDYIFVHGWIPTLLIGYGAYKKKYYLSNWREANEDVWEEATRINGMDAWDWGVREPNKTICCGHWHTSWGHVFLHGEHITEFGSDANFTPFKDTGIVAMDACTALTHLVNCEVIEI